MRTRASPNAPTRVPGELLAEAGSWDPNLYCGPAARVTFAPHKGLSLAELDAECLEGYRPVVPRDPSEADLDGAAELARYRLANVGCMALEPGPEHGSPPKLQGRWCALPGDVIVTKVAPIRAALVSERAHRHPVDSTCLIVRGLEFREAVWLALCLNQPEYGSHLVRGQVLLRLSATTLRELRLPEPPLELAARVPDLIAWLDRRAEASAALGQVQVEADELAAAAAADAGLVPADGDSPDCGWLSPATFGTTTWLPLNAFARAEAARLAAAGWPALRDLARAGPRGSEDPGHGHPIRLATLEADERSVRLSDVGTDLYVRSDLDPVTPSLVRRHFAAPLMPGDVLLSAEFASNPRSAFVDLRVPVRAHPIDLWQRLIFDRAPAAWALVLMTPSIARQLRMLAYGAVIAHVFLEDLLTVRMPPVQPERLEDWERAVSKHHEVRRELDAGWARLWPALVVIFDRAHPPLDATPAKARS